MLRVRGDELHLFGDGDGVRLAVRVLRDPNADAVGLLDGHRITDDDLVPLGDELGFRQHVPHAIAIARIVPHADDDKQGDADDDGVSRVVDDTDSIAFRFAVPLVIFIEHGVPLADGDGRSVSFTLCYDHTNHDGCGVGFTRGVAHTIHDGRRDSDQNYDQRRY